MYVFSGKSAYDDGLSNYIFVMAKRRTFPRVNGWRRERGGEVIPSWSQEQSRLADVRGC